jgi:transcriptional regulator with XRE-family HTH domain
VSQQQGAATAIGAAVRARRRALGLSMRDLSGLIGTSQPFVSNIENGRIFPSLRTLELLAEALDVSSDQLLRSPEKVDRTTVDALPHPDAEMPPTPGRLLDAVRLPLAPHEREARPRIHPGEEIVRVLRGHAVLLRESEAPHPLTEGEAVWIDGTVPHRMEAGPRGATVLLIRTAEGERS